MNYNTIKQIHETLKRGGFNGSPCEKLDNTKSWRSGVVVISSLGEKIFITDLEQVFDFFVSEGKDCPLIEEWAEGG